MTNATANPAPPARSPARPRPPSAFAPAGAAVIGAYLRHLRERREATPADAAHTIRTSPGAVRQMERGHIVHQWEAVAQLLRWHGVSEPVHQAVHTLVLQAGDDCTRRHSTDAGAGWAERLNAVERQAVGMSVYASATVPPAFQTPAYAHAVGQMRSAAAQQAHAARSMPMGHPSGYPVELLLDQSILLRPVGESGVLTQQFARLCQDAERGHAIVRVVPLDCPVAVPGVNLTELAMADCATPVLYIQQTPFAATYSLGAEGQHRRLMDQIRDHAQTPERSLALVRQARAHLCDVTADPVPPPRSGLPIDSTGILTPTRKAR
ncbi:Scr1 family TA system antitoxin-like transcriptional regulator [Streptomyces olivoreticuli]